MITLDRCCFVNLFATLFKILQCLGTWRLESKLSSNEEFPIKAYLYLTLFYYLMLKFLFFVQYLWPDLLKIFVNIIFAKNTKSIAVVRKNALKFSKQFNELTGYNMSKNNVFPTTWVFSFL